VTTGFCLALLRLVGFKGGKGRKRAGPGLAGRRWAALRPIEACVRALRIGVKRGRQSLVHDGSKIDPPIHHRLRPVEQALACPLLNGSLQLFDQCGRPKLDLYRHLELGLNRFERDDAGLRDLGVQPAGEVQTAAAGAIDPIGQDEPLECHKFEQAGDRRSSAAVAAISPLVPSLISSTLSGRDRTGVSMSFVIKDRSHGDRVRKPHLAGVKRRDALRGKVVHQSY
jgi:hypothetical protein